MRNPERIGRVAKIRYKGGVKGEEAVDDRSSGEPLEVVIGSGSMPRGIDEELFDMEIGESKIVEIPPERGFGVYNEKVVDWHLRAMIANGYDLVVGSRLAWNNAEEGISMPARVTEVTKDMVRIDLNHPFAGKTLVYELELVDIQ
jgi:FKBP-type peptidyl-prolyl cis-trans isomerase 2